MKKLLLFQILIFFLSSCIEKPPVINDISGVVITFDDKYIDDWFWADSILQQYQWKATFFVTKINTLNQSQIDKLKMLSSFGHEIAGHGYNHFNSDDYVRKFGIQKYIDDEITPMIHFSDSLNLHLMSFAYPYGACNNQTDSALLEHFLIIRKLSWYSNNPATQDCYFDYNRIIYGFPLDDNYKGTNWEYIEELLKYAKQNNKILILYGHDVSEIGTRDYYENIEKLQKICNFVNQNNMKFYTAKDLYNLIYPKRNHK